MIHDNIVLDQFAQDLIRRNARILVGRVRFTEDEQEDLEQELRLRLLQSQHRFDPNRGHRNAFITTIVERHVAMILRERRAKKRDSGVVQSLDRAKDDGLGEPPDTRRNVEKACDLAIDLAEALAKLPPDLSDLAERRKSQSLSKVARALGVPRTTLQRKMERILRCFEDAGLRIYS